MSYFSQRRDRLRRMLKPSGADAVLVTNPVNVTYLTGFQGDSTYLLMNRVDAVLLTDTRYEEQIAEEASDVPAEIRNSSTTMNELLTRIARRLKISNLAVDAVSLSYHAYLALDKALEKTSLVPTDGWVESLREIKDRMELEAIEHSISLAERAFAVIRSSLRSDQTELEIAHNLEHQIRLFGGTECAFEPIVGVGPRAALPHAIPSERRIFESPFVLIDWGAKAGGYTSDLTRVLVTGKLTAKLKKVYNTVLKAQLAAIAKIKPGVPASTVDAAARTIIAKAGHDKHFGHGLGHGFGLEIHENPRMAPINDAPLKAGMVVTVEPGIYLPGWGGVRIEDDILITKDGHRVLTHVTKDIEECIVW